jgi:myosin heavy subunit
LITGASEDFLKTLGMTKDFRSYNYLKNTFLETLKTVDDKECFDDCANSFKKMEFTSGEINAVWAYTASSLHLGNLEFDGSKFDETSKSPCGVKDEKPLRLVSDLLKVDYDALSSALRIKTIIDPGTKQAINSPIKLDECNISRDSLAKDLYNKLFDWLVKRLNYTTIPGEFLDGDLNVDAVTNDPKFYHVGLLDIFGFEILEPNSLEQLCINFTNEKLQQLYIEYVFNSEKKEFKNEGLGEFIGELRCEDNKPVIDLLDNTKTGSTGIFQMIDDASAVATSTEDGLRNKIIEAHNKVFPPPDPKKFRAPNPPAFIIKHTACPVEYQITGFKNKNKDELSKPLVDCLSASKDEDIAKVWKFLCKNEKEKKADANSKPNPKEKFLGYKFVNQMKDLYNELDRCSCHFVRCIKPNPTKTKGILKQMMTLEQIKYMGILDTIRVRKDSYPVRRQYKLFYQRYEYLHPTASSMMFEDHEAKGSDFLQFTRE